MGPEMNYLNERPFDPLTFMVYLDSSGQATGSYYEDDGLSQDYENKKMYRRTVIRAQKEAKKLRLSIEAGEGELKVAERTIIIRILPLLQVRSVIVDGHPLPLSASGGSGTGWSKESGSISIRMSDNGQGHSLEIE